MLNLYFVIFHIVHRGNVTQRVTVHLYYTIVCKIHKERERIKGKSLKESTKLITLSLSLSLFLSTNVRACEQERKIYQQTILHIYRQ